MTNPFYTQMQGVATNLLRQFGNPSFIRYIGPKQGGTDDPDFGGQTGGTEPDPVDIAGVVISIERRYIDGETVRATDQMLVCDSQVVLEEDGRLLIGGRKWTIIQLLPVNPAGQLLVQKAVIRG